MARGITVFAALTTLLALAAAPAAAHHVGCGDTISVNTRLDSDLVGCPGDGLVIGAPDVTLDLDGHVISGTGAFSSSGVVINESRALVRYGVIRGFESGVYVTSGNNTTLRRLTIFGNTDGILIGGAGANNSTPGVLVRNNVLADNANAGLLTVDSYNVRASLNLAVGNGLDGILFGGETFRSIAQYNVTSGNGDDGIHVDDSAPEGAPSALNNTVTGNTATFNGDLGIEAIAGTVDGGGNRAFGNGNPLQCVYVECG